MECETLKLLQIGVFNKYYILKTIYLLKNKRTECQ